MHTLDPHDWRRLSEFLREAYAFRGLPSFRDWLVESLPRLVPCDVAGFAEIRLDRGTSRNWFWPGEAHDSRRDRLWERHMHEHPVLAHTARTGRTAILKISDFLTRRQFRQTGLYCDVYRPMGVEDNLVATQALPPLVIGLAAHRGGRRSFSERDRAMLSVAQPHLALAYQNARALTRVGERLRMAERVLDGLDEGVVVLAPDGRIRFASSIARRWLGEYFDHRARHRLPEGIRRWIRHADAAPSDGDARSRNPLVAHRDGRRLTVRFMAASDESLLLLEERRTAIDADDLRSLGLTRQEAHVLSWVAQGKTNPEIALIVGARPRTVEKHLEHIFEKLGVETRTSAAAVALTRPSRRRG